MRQIYPNNADRSIRMCGIGTPDEIDLSVCVV